MSENDCPLQLLLPARVVRTWRDDDGYGNEDGDYLTLPLKNAIWGPSNLLARIPYAKDSDDPPPLVVGKNYAIKGGLYRKVPQKQWHQEYLAIKWHKEMDGELEAANPQFDLVCKVVDVDERGKNGRIGLAWRVWDQYERAAYGKIISLECKEAVSHVKDNMNKLYKFSGQMTAPGVLRVNELECTKFAA